MLETLLHHSGEQGDLFSFLYDHLVNRTFLGHIGYQTWFDLAGLGAGFAGGYKKQLRVGMYSFGIAALPEFMAFCSSLFGNPDTPIDECVRTLFHDGGGDAVFVGAGYFLSRALRAYRDKPSLLDTAS